ncbi:hypothetical protein BDW69DRAFT_190528 [Aspergillus filifer]
MKPSTALLKLCPSMTLQATAPMGQKFPNRTLGQMASIQGKNNYKLLPDAYNWILRTKEYQAFADWSDQPSCQVLWLYGPAGTGKIMLNIGIISKTLGQSSNLTPCISYYFCQVDKPSTNSATDVLRSLIWLLLIQQPHLFSHLRDSHKSDEAAMFNASNFYRVRNLFKAMLSDERLIPVYLVIDALDECTDEQPGVQELISLVSDFLEISRNSKKKIKWLLSSRPEVDVLNRLSDDKTGVVFELDVQAQEEAVDAYITHKLSQLKHELRYPKKDLEGVGAEIRKRAQDIFFWVALVFRYLFTERVPSFKALSEVKKNPSDLSKLYRRMMARINEADDDDKAYCKSLLEVACFASRPLSYAEIHVLSGLPSHYSSEYIVQKCGSFLTVENTTVLVLHNSTRQFLNEYFEDKLL